MPASGIFRFHFLPGQIRAPVGWLCLDIVFVDALFVRPPSKPFWPYRDLRTPGTEKSANLPHDLCVAFYLLSARNFAMPLSDLVIGALRRGGPLVDASLP